MAHKALERAHSCATSAQRQLNLYIRPRANVPHTTPRYTRTRTSTTTPVLAQRGVEDRLGARTQCVHFSLASWHQFAGDVHGVFLRAIRIRARLEGPPGSPNVG